MDGLLCSVQEGAAQCGHRYVSYLYIYASLINVSLSPPGPGMRPAFLLLFLVPRAGHRAAHVLAALATTCYLFLFIYF
jgi:hypothetical protein